jgi:hypothetical protein
LTGGDRLVGRPANQIRAHLWLIFLPAVCRLRIAHGYFVDEAAGESRRPIASGLTGSRPRLRGNPETFRLPSRPTQLRGSLMRHALFTLILIVAALAPAPEPKAPAAGAESRPAEVVLVRSGRQKLTADQKQKLAAWSLDFVKTCRAMDTVNDAAILKQSVTDIQRHYRETVQRDYLVATFDHPVTVKRDGAKEVTLVEIVVGLDDHFTDDQPHPLFPSGLFTLDPDGRQIAYEKYRGQFPDGIVSKATTAPAP